MSSGDGPEERHDELVGGAVVHVAGDADLLDPALVQHRDPVGDVERLLLVVGDQHGGHVHLVVQAPQPRPQVLTHLGVERTERLVEQQHLGVDRQGAGQRHALPLTTGELRGVAGLEAASPTTSSSSSTLALISAFGRLRIFSPKATLSRTVMCLNAA